MAADLLPGERRIGRIPVRNLWLLMLYASDLTRVRGALNAITGDDIDDLPDLVARLLANAVEHRLRRNLTRGYLHRDMVLTRVRGRIDLLMTERSQLLSKGEVFCRVEDLTMDTPRNRLVRSALDLMSGLYEVPKWPTDAALWHTASLGPVCVVCDHPAPASHPIELLGA
jgi:5-methylcytosine-specific restriction enzyme subunit McrC